MTEPSASVKQAMARRTSDNVPVLCIKVYTPNEQDPTVDDTRWPLLFCDNTQNISHDDGGGAQTYVGVPMDWASPDREANEIPELIINLMGLGETYSDLMRTIGTDPPRVDAFTVTLNTASGLTQNTRDDELLDLRLKELEGRFGVQFTLRKREFSGPYPVRRYDGITFPGLR